MSGGRWYLTSDDEGSLEEASFGPFSVPDPDGATTGAAALRDIEKAAGLPRGELILRIEADDRDRHWDNETGPFYRGRQSPGDYTHPGSVTYRHYPGA